MASPHPSFLHTSSVIYVAIFCGLVGLRFITARHARLKDQIYPVVLAGLFVFVAFRLDVGCDWNGYYRHFLIQLDLDLSHAVKQREPLWWALVQITGQLGFGYPWLNVASAIIFFTGLHILARQQPDRLGFLILLFPILIINMPMSGIRQAAAIGMICMAFVAVNHGRTMLFVLSTLIATGFHSSAGVFLFLAPFVGQGWIKTRLFISLCLLVPGLWFLMSGESAQIALSRYVETGVDAHGALYRSGLLALTSAAFFTFLRPQWNTQSTSDHRLISLAALMMLGTLPLVAFSSVIADRFGYYLIPLQTVIFARLPFLDVKGIGPVATALPYIVLLIVLVVWANLSTHFSYCYVPYDNWLFAFPEQYQFQN